MACVPAAPLRTVSPPPPNSHIEFSSFKTSLKISCCPPTWNGLIYIDGHCHWELHGIFQLKELHSCTGSMSENKDSFQHEPERQNRAITSNSAYHRAVIPVDSPCSFREDCLGNRMRCMMTQFWGDKKKEPWAVSWAAISTITLQQT